ncbi:MAG: glycosyltransferase, partial [Eubacterium sp.]|nr:glycosyltransferase [Eubacterium sp.]
NQSRSPSVAVKYYILVIVQLTVSALLVNYALLFIPYSTIRKIIVDTILFGLRFLIQREWVFR